VLFWSSVAHNSDTSVSEKNGKSIENGAAEQPVGKKKTFSVKRAAVEPKQSLY
jgi:hypothetical protein